MTTIVYDVVGCIVHDLISHELDVDFVERQAQHRPDRLKKPRTGSVRTDR